MQQNKWEREDKWKSYSSQSDGKEQEAAQAQRPSDGYFGQKEQRQRKKKASDYWGKK